MRDQERRRVAIIGGGVAGLTLGLLLRSRGVDCVVLEARSREYADRRQRGGTVDTRGVRMFRERGLGRVVESDEAPDVTALRMFIDGSPFVLGAGDGEEERDQDGDAGVFIPQQVLVRNLTDALLAAGGDLRFSTEVLSIEEGTGGALVRFRTADGIDAIECDLVAGADGFHGISRRSIPVGALEEFRHEYGFAWLTLLVELSTTSLEMAVSERGYAASIPRGRKAARVYLQVPLDTSVDEWPDERIRNEVDRRFGEHREFGAILDRRVVPLRSVVFEPMSVGRVFLLGDAAHIVPPMSAKGIHLALHDAELLADAIVMFVDSGDRTGLDGYSEAALDHVWNYQAFAMWTTRMHHDAGDGTLGGPFARRLAQAELRRLATLPAAEQLYGEFLAGTA